MKINAQFRQIYIFFSQGELSFTLKQLKVFLLLIGLFYPCYLFPQDFQVKRRTGIIISVSEDVTFKTSLSAVESKAFVGFDLMKGDSVIIGKNGQARVLFMDGVIVNLNSSTRLYIDTNWESSRIIEGNISRPIAAADFLNVCIPKIIIASLGERDSAMVEKDEVRRRSRGDIIPSLVPVLPAKTIYNTQPTFIWYDPRSRPKRDENQRYTLIIYKEQVIDEEFVSKEIVRYTVSGRTFTFNKFTLSQPLPYSGEYQWDIYVKGQEPEKDSEAKPRGSFRILDSMRAQQIQDRMECFLNELYKNSIDENTYHLLVGSYLKDQKLFYEAALVYEELSKKLNNSYPFEELAVLYKKFGDDVILKLNETIKKAKQQ